MVLMPDKNDPNPFAGLPYGLQGFAGMVVKPVRDWWTMTPTEEENYALRIENDRFRAAWAKWRPAIERGRERGEREGPESWAKGFASMIADFDLACQIEVPGDDTAT